MDRFFGVYIPTTSVAGMSFVLLIAVLLGGLVGLEREIHAHPAGLRTHILVCVGSCLITLVSVNMGHGSNDRIAAQVVTGVGFLGAGAIIREGASVKGLTTAASIWATAGVGIALGTSPFFGQIAVIATMIILFTLWILNQVEDWLENTGRRVITLEVTCEDRPELAGRIVERVGGLGVRVSSVTFATNKAAGTREICMRVALRRDVDRASLVELTSKEEGVTAVQIG
jgi:putative Mg2+ transporter-C (MgtC) family protein